MPQRFRLPQSNEGIPLYLADEPNDTQRVARSFSIHQAKSSNAATVNSIDLTT